MRDSASWSSCGIIQQKPNVRGFPPAIPGSEMAAGIFLALSAGKPPCPYYSRLGRGIWGLEGGGAAAIPISYVCARGFI